MPERQQISHRICNIWRCIWGSANYC